MNRLRFVNGTLFFFTIIFFCHNAGSLPASSFIIIPSGIIDTVYQSSRTVYKVESSDEDFTLPSTASQQILSVKPGNEKSIILISAGENPLTENKNTEVFLRNTPYLNLDKEIIKKTAGNFKNSKDQPGDVSAFVYHYISDKKIGIPLLPAASILQGKAGDCTEHSVLTIALLRALKIPSRAVMGLILVENFSDKQNVFVYHMWVEAYRNGKWVLVDSTRPASIHHNRYIALAYHNLMTETPLEYLQAISTIQNLKISYVR